ncbi:MAG: hypothetical protein NVSMB52_00810 [Chloroflexota bacterium]
MTDNVNDSQNFSVSVPVGALGTLVVLGLAATAYIVYGRTDGEDPVASAAKSKLGGGMRKKLGIMTLVTLIENDTTRKLLVSVLRAMARRA